MDPHKQSLTERIEDGLKEALGLPLGKRPDGEPKPSDPESPRGTLTADDAEGLPPHGDLGTGLARR